MTSLWHRRNKFIIKGLGRDFEWSGAFGRDSQMFSSRLLVSPELPPVAAAENYTSSVVDKTSSTVINSMRFGSLSTTTLVRFPAIATFAAAIATFGTN
jgi:hypothetical protein